MLQPRSCNKPQSLITEVATASNSAKHALPQNRLHLGFRVSTKGVCVCVCLCVCVCVCVGGCSFKKVWE